MATDSAVTVDQAREYILSKCSQITETQSADLYEAVGRVCAADIKSSVCVPGYDNSAMDGYAFRWGDIESPALAKMEFPLCGVSLAGHPYEGELPIKKAVRITTGAKMPKGADTVIAYEKTEFTDTAVKFNSSAVRMGANVRKAGEDIQEGDTIVAAGTRLTPAHIALLASVGIARVPVFRKPIVTLIATGDELTEPGDALGPGGIYNSGAAALISLMKSESCEVRYTGIVRDNPESIAQQLREAQKCSDLILMTGGAADSTADYSHQEAARMGELAPWTVNMRPGRPIRFGTIGATAFFILPGNPVASFVTFFEFARGALRYIEGQAQDVWPQTHVAHAGAVIRTKPGRAEFMRGSITGFDQKGPITTPLTNQSSASLLTLSKADVIIYVGHDEEEIALGAPVKIQWLNGCG